MTKKYDLEFAAREWWQTVYSHVHLPDGTPELDDLDDLFNEPLQRLKDAGQWGTTPVNWYVDTYDPVPTSNMSYEFCIGEDGPRSSIWQVQFRGTLQGGGPWNVWFDSYPEFVIQVMRKGHADRVIKWFKDMTLMAKFRSGEDGSLAAG